jgi:putative copper export protein
VRPTSRPHVRRARLCRRRRTGQRERELGTQLVATIFAVLMVTAAFAFIVRHPRLFVPVLAVQTVLLAAAGERWLVLAAALALCMMLAGADLRPSRRQAPAALALTAVAVLAVTGSVSRMAGHCRITTAALLPGP